MTKILNDIKGARAEVRAKVSIVQVVTDDLGPAVKQTGQDHMWCCPLHGEKTPSFGVHESMGIFKCFGCGKGGDATTWLQEFMGVSTVEAIEALAIRYAIDLTPFEREPTKEEKHLQLLYRINEEAGKICSRNFFANKEIMQWYMNDTKFTAMQIADYDVGYSTSSESLINELYQKFPEMSQSDADALEFTRRIMWNNALVYPVKDAGGRTVRFHNKPLSPPSDMAAKYVGTSSEHPLFTNKVLYGFSHIRKSLKSGKIRLCEGQKAAIASGGVALLGSSIKAEQIELLKEYSLREVVVCLDGDKTGKEKSLKVLDDVPEFGDINVLIARMPDGKQPDDLPPDELETVFNNAKLPVEYYVNVKTNNPDILDEIEKNRIIRDLKGYLSRLPEIHMEMSANYLGKLLNVDPSSIRAFVSEVKATGNTLFNRDVELSLIRHTILTHEYWSTVRQYIEEPSVFTTLPHQKIYEVLDILHKKNKELSLKVTITPQAIRDELIIRFPQFKDISNYVDVVLNSEAKYDFNDSLNRVTDLHKRRTAITQSKIFMASMQDLKADSADVVTQYRRQLVSVLDVRKDQSTTPVQLATSVMKEIELRSMNKSAVIGHDFSVIRDVDGVEMPALTGLTIAMQGIQKQHQIIISANSGVGKSLLALQMATSIAVCPESPEDRVPTLWIPLEMNNIEITMRIISQISGVDNNRVQAGNLTRDESARVKKAMEMISEGKLYMHKPRFGHVEELYSIIDEYRFKYGVETVILDYIQMVANGPADRGASREEVIGKCSKMMKLQVAESMGVASICIAQQNRANFKHGEISKTESVGGSYQVAQDADDFFIMSEKTLEQIEEAGGQRGNRRGFLDKRRGGASDVVLDLNLDTVGCSLRFIESITPGQLAGLSLGMKK